MTPRVLIFLAFVACIQCTVLNLSCEQKKAFVDGHNNWRLKLAQGKITDQPAASQMKYMIWDSELAEKAAGWASVYRKQHNPDRTVVSGRFSTGENLYWYASTDKHANVSIETALESWWTEHLYYKYDKLSYKDFSGSKQIGHYTQMAWSDSVYVGCAISKFSSLLWHKFMVACNYGPSGNVIGQAPYKSGSPAKKLTCSLKSCKKPYGSKCN